MYQTITNINGAAFAVYGDSDMILYISEPTSGEVRGAAESVVTCCANGHLFPILIRRVFAVVSVHCVGQLSIFFVSFDTGAYCLYHFGVETVEGTFLGMSEDSFEPDDLVSADTWRCSANFFADVTMCTDAGAMFRVLVLTLNSASTTNVMEFRVRCTKRSVLPKTIFCRSTHVTSATIV